MYKYECLRGGQCQETMYNTARMLHQLGIVAGAIHFYERVLNDTKAPLVLRAEPGAQGDKKVARPDPRYDLRPLAAHNLAFIYETSGNRAKARQLLEKHCTI